MKTASVLTLALGAALAAFVSATPAFAQASRTWISGVGDDANPCSRTAPCKTFAGAISKTAANGEINCLDAGGFGAVTITKSITLDCTGTMGSILHAGTNGVVINFNAFTDARRTVRIRNINFNGFDTGLIGVRILGNVPNSEVFIEGVLIDGNFGGAARGVSDERTAGGELSISDTTVRNTGGTGVSIPAGGTGRIDATLDNVNVQNAAYGVAASNGAHVAVINSVISGAETTGVHADPGAEITLDQSMVTDNFTGLETVGGGVIRLANTNILSNGTGISGQTLSYGNNRIAGNTNAGQAPTLIGATSNPTGQQ